MIATINGRTIKLRLHVHQSPDPERSEYYGGPLGQGYLDGPLDDLKYLKSVMPETLHMMPDPNDSSEKWEEEISVVKYHEADVMWDRDDYVHGIMHLDWVNNETDLYR